MEKSLNLSCGIKDNKMVCILKVDNREEGRFELDVKPESVDLKVTGQKLLEILKK